MRLGMILLSFQPQAGPTVVVTSADREGLQMPRRATAIALFLLAACAAPGGVEGPPDVAVGGEKHSVVSVIDGDTIVVESDDQEERVRLIGVNAPEAGECLAEEATRAPEELTGPYTVRLVAD